MNTSQHDTMQLPGYRPGRWRIDPVHSELGFAVRHMMISKVKGRFRGFTGEITTGPEITGSSATVTIEMSSVDTGDARRDDHLRSEDFFDVVRHPTMTYQADGLTRSNGELVLGGQLTIKRITNIVPLIVDFHGFAEIPDGQTLAGFSARGGLNRREFGIDYDIPLPGGGVVIADRIDLHLEIESALVNSPDPEAARSI